MDRFSTAVVKFLEGHPAIQDVAIDRGAACTQEEMADWCVRWQKQRDAPGEHCIRAITFVESSATRRPMRNTPFRLPADLQAFYEVCNGLKITWSGSSAAASRQKGPSARIAASPTALGAKVGLGNACVLRREAPC